MGKRGMLSQLGVADESVYGTFVAPSTKFYEFRPPETITRDIARIESEGIRAGRYNTARTGAYASHQRGAGGDVTLEVMTKGWAWWLKHMMGTVVTTGVNPYTHTGSVGSLIGDSFSMEIGRDDQRFRYEGGKVMSWTLNAAVGELLTCSLTLDFEAEDSTQAALTTASYPSGMIPFSFLDGALTVGGTATHVREAKVTGNNNLANERYFIRGSGLKKEPMDQGREYSGSLTAEFEDKVAYDRFVNGTEAALVLTFTGPSPFTFKVDAPLVRFDGETPTVGGPDIIPMNLPYRCLDDSITLQIVNQDAVP